MKTELKTIWTGDNQGHGRLETSNHSIPIAIPTDLGGSGEGTEPKSLLLASASACYSMTLVAILKNRKLAAHSVSMESFVEVQNDGSVNIQHRPRIVLEPGSEDQVDAVTAALSAADRACFIGNLLKKAGTDIAVSGDITVGV